MTTDLDHIILGCPDLDEGIAYVEKVSGYHAAPGGSHPGRGTRNALLKIGPESYLEILAPDPEQKGLHWHETIVKLSEPRLIGWAVKASRLDDLAASFENRGIPVIGPTPGSRTAPNGDVLRWTTLTRVNDCEGMFPFYIEWDARSNHPAHRAPGQCLLLEFHDTARLREEVALASRDPRIETPGTHELRAIIRGQLGEFVLSSSPSPAPQNSALQ